jgi:hypothetical protein
MIKEMMKPISLSASPIIFKPGHNRRVLIGAEARPVAAFGWDNKRRIWGMAGTNRPKRESAARSRVALLLAHLT